MLNIFTLYITVTGCGLPSIIVQVKIKEAIIMEAAPVSLQLRVQGTATPVQFNREVLSEAKTRVAAESLTSIDVTGVDGQEYTFPAAVINNEALATAIGDSSQAVDLSSLPEVTP